MKLARDGKKYRYVKKKQNDITKSSNRIKPSKLAKKVLLKGENIREFEELRQKVLSEGYPQTEIENILCEKIIFTLWKIRRAAEIEKNLLNKENEITFEEQHPNSWDPPQRKRICNINRVRMQTPEVQAVMQHQIDLEKMLQKLLSRLRAEQKLRKQEKNDEK